MSKETDELFGAIEEELQKLQKTNKLSTIISVIIATLVGFLVGRYTL